MQPTYGLQGTHAALCTHRSSDSCCFLSLPLHSICRNLNLILVYWIEKKVDLLDFIHLPLFFLNETWEKLNVNYKSQDLGDFSEGTEYGITCRQKVWYLKLCIVYWISLDVLYSPKLLHANTLQLLVIVKHFQDVSQTCQSTSKRNSLKILGFKRALPGYMTLFTSSSLCFSFFLFWFMVR